MATKSLGKTAERNAKRRQWLFDLYAANAAVHLEGCSGNDFYCPVCESHFDRTALNHPVRLDIAHVYPAACGGSQVTMTCKACNSRIGYRFDSHLTNEKRLIDAMGGSGLGTIDVRAKVQGVSIGAQISRCGDHFDVRQIQKQSHPKTVQEIKDRMTAGCAAHVSFEMPAPDEKRIAASLLHSAYLAAFRFFGYEYVIHADSQSIRDALMKDDPPAKLPMYHVDLHGAGPEFRVHTIGFALVDGKHKCVAAAMPYPDNRSVGRAILLPGFDPDGREAFEAIMKRWDVSTAITYQVDMDNPGERLRDVAFGNYGRRRWQTSFTQAS